LSQAPLLGSSHGGIPGGSRVCEGSLRQLQAQPALSELFPESEEDGPKILRQMCEETGGEGETQKNIKVRPAYGTQTKI